MLLTEHLFIVCLNGLMFLTNAAARLYLWTWLVSGEVLFFVCLFLRLFVCFLGLLFLTEPHTYLSQWTSFDVLWTLCSGYICEDD